MKAREYFKRGLIDPRKIPGQLNPADLPTKILAPVPHHRLNDFIANRPTSGLRLATTAAAVSSTTAEPEEI